MTRVQFLNDLYHHLYGLTQDQAEQHLTYYAEMLADRMEEGMSEEEAVAGMEDVETIARRIMEEEGLPYTPPEERPVVPPSYPDPTRMGGGNQFTRAYQAPKKPHWKKIVQVVLWIVAAVAILGAVTTAISERSWRRTDAPTDTSSPVAVAEELAPYAESWEYTEMPYEMGYDYTESEFYIGIDDIHTLNIEWAAGMVYIQTYGGDDVMVQEYGEYELTDRTRMKLTQSGNVWSITYRDGIGLGNVKGGKWLMVLVPEGLFGEININTTSAAVQTAGLELDTLRVNTVSGDISCLECYVQTSELATVSGDFNLSHLCADRTEISTASGYMCGDIQSADLSANSISGDISLTLYGGIKKLDLNTTSGDIWVSIDEPSIQSIGASSISGDISLSLPWDTGYTLDYTTVSGDIYLPSYEGSQSPSKSGRYVHEGGECQINAATTSGDINIY